MDTRMEGNQHPIDSQQQAGRIRRRMIEGGLQRMWKSSSEERQSPRREKKDRISSFWVFEDSRGREHLMSHGPTKDIKRNLIEDLICSKYGAQKYPRCDTRYSAFGKMPNEYVSGGSTWKIPMEKASRERKVARKLKRSVKKLTSREQRAGDFGAKGREHIKGEDRVSKDTRSRGKRHRGEKEKVSRRTPRRRNEECQGETQRACNREEEEERTLKGEQRSGRAPTIEASTEKDREEGGTGREIYVANPNKKESEGRVEAMWRLRCHQQIRRS
eukprot:Gb_38225 [translate_table: standard]